MLRNQHFAALNAAFLHSKATMSIQDQIANVKAELADLESQLQVAIPHLTVLAEIESFTDRMEQEARVEFAAAIAKARSLF